MQFKCNVAGQPPERGAVGYFAPGPRQFRMTTACLCGRAACGAYRQSSPGIVRFMNSSNIGTVKAVSPWFGLQIIPLAISELRVGASDVTLAG